MRVFVAGASGVVGRRLVPQLVDRGPRRRRDRPDSREARDPPGPRCGGGRDGRPRRGLCRRGRRHGRARGGHPPDVGPRRDVRPAPVRRGVRAHERAADTRPRPPADRFRGRRRPPVRGAELHRLAQRAGRRPGQDGERSARSRSTRTAAAVDRGDRLSRAGRDVGGADRGRRASLREPVRPRDVDGERVRRPHPGAEAPARRRRRRRLVVHSTPTTQLRLRSSRPRGEPRASTTSSTTSRRPSRCGCRTWPSAWAPVRRGTCRPGSHVSRSARSASR